MIYEQPCTQQFYGNCWNLIWHLKLFKLTFLSPTCIVHKFRHCRLRLSWNLSMFGQFQEALGTKASLQWTEIQLEIVGPKPGLSRSFFSAFDHDNNDQKTINALERSMCFCLRKGHFGILYFFLLSTFTLLRDTACYSVRMIRNSEITLTLVWRYVYQLQCPVQRTAVIILSPNN